MILKMLIVTLAILVVIANAVAAGNAPGGAYVQCDPRNKNSPVRCTTDGW